MTPDVADVAGRAGWSVGNEFDPPHTPFFRFDFTSISPLSPEPKFPREAILVGSQDGPQMGSSDAGWAETFRAVLSDGSAVERQGSNYGKHN